MASFAINVVTVALVVCFLPSALGSQTFVPGVSTVYNDYNGTVAPYPANNSAPILPSSNGPAGADDLLFQNLLSAEWLVFNFYQQGVEGFTASNFTDAGYKSNTYQRIQQIRDNEAGHLLIFQESISGTSLKPGPCQYEYGFGNSTDGWLELQIVIELSSMAFITALALEANLNTTKGALIGIAEVETRHLTWGLIDVWNTDPFSGPADTVYPYVNQILDSTNQFVIPGSCPAANPVYPNPRQNLPQLKATTGGLPGSPVTFKYSNASHVPSFAADKDYYAVFFHGVLNISMPFDPTTSSSVIPPFENLGIILAVIADAEGAPTLESVLAGPSYIVLQPAGLSV